MLIPTNNNFKNILHVTPYWNLYETEDGILAETL